MQNTQLFVFTIFLVVLFAQCTSQRVPTWQDQFKASLAEFGHRNWIVIADEAYPKQSAPGIQTIATGQNHFEVLNFVLNEIRAARHVNPIVLMDAELKYVPEALAPGVEDCRKRLKQMTADFDVNVMNHEDIIANLDEASELFNVLILKTDLVIPYTSVFIQLDCGYWGPDQEKQLRETMRE